MTRRILTYLGLAVILLGVGCDKGQGAGLLALSLTGGDGLPHEAASHIVFGLSNGDSRTYARQRFPLPGNTPLLLELPNLPAGKLIVDVKALDNGNCLVAEATKSVEIVAGKRNEASVILEAAKGTCADGGATPPTGEDAASAGSRDTATPGASDASFDIQRENPGRPDVVTDTRGTGGALGGSGGTGGQGGGGANTGSTVVMGGSTSGGQNSGGTSGGGAGGSTGAGGASADAGASTGLPDTNSPILYTLQVSMQGSGTGKGTGTITGPNLDCGKTCTATYPEGTKVKLTATPDSLSVFTGWIAANCSGTGSCELTMTKNLTVTAKFAGPEPLTVTRKGAGTGSVVANVGDLVCGDKCSALYPLGTEVVLTAAVSDTASAFAGWTGACSGIDNCKVTIDQARQVAAVFTWKFTQVSAGAANTCAVRAGGQVVCWGAGTTPEPEGGQSIPPSGMFKSVSAGGNHTCGIRIDDTVACWGANRFQQATPPSGTFLSVSAGWELTCGIQSNGSLACWGSNIYKQANPPAGTFTAVAAGTFHGCGIQPFGGIVCWGQLDAVVNLGQATPPPGAFASISAGDYHTCGVVSGVETPVKCWGNNADGQSSPPTGNFQSVSVSNQLSCGLLSNGNIACWGSTNGWPDLQSPPPGPFTQIATGHTHVCGLRPSGALVCFGNNDAGQLDLPTK